MKYEKPRTRPLTEAEREAFLASGPPLQQGTYSVPWHCLTDEQQEAFVAFSKPLTYIPPVVEEHVLWWKLERRSMLELLADVETEPVHDYHVRSWRGLSTLDMDYRASLAQWLAGYPRTDVAIGDVFFRRVPRVRRIDWRRSVDPHVVLTAVVLRKVTLVKAQKHLRNGWSTSSPGPKGRLGDADPDGSAYL